MEMLRMTGINSNMNASFMMSFSGSPVGASLNRKKEDEESAPSLDDQIRMLAKTVPGRHEETRMLAEKVQEKIRMLTEKVHDRDEEIRILTKEVQKLKEQSPIKKLGTKADIVDLNTHTKPGSVSSKIQSAPSSRRGSRNMVPGTDI